MAEQLNPRHQYTRAERIARGLEDAHGNVLVLTKAEAERESQIRRVPVHTPGESKSHREYLRRCRES